MRLLFILVLISFLAMPVCAQKTPNTPPPSSQTGSAKEGTGTSTPVPRQSTPPARQTDAPSGLEAFLLDREGFGDLAALDTARGVDYLSEEEKDLILEMNLVRTNPKAYVRIVEQYLGWYEGNLIRLPGMTAIRSNEGVAAVQELIRFLKSAPTRSPLVPARGLTRAARDHATDQGRTGQTGHTGSDGSTMSTRINRYGTWSYSAAENIDYGYARARLAILSLLIDDGVASRGHRTNIMNSSLEAVGVAMGPHRVYRHMAVFDFAGSYQDR